MSIAEMSECLTTIYDSRLQALIGYENTDITRLIVRYMFSHFEYLALHTTQKGYETSQLGYFSDLLSFKPGPDSISCSQARSSAKELTLGLENYIRTNLELLYPDWRDENDERDWRKVIGEKYRKAAEDRPSLYPQRLNYAHIITQLNQTTIYRHQCAHKQRYGNSAIYERYVILKAYDVILCYLLYTFYYMCLAPEYERLNIKWN